MGYTVRTLGWRYGNFDIILVHPTRVCQPSTTPLVPCAMLYLVPMLGGCWLVLGIRCCGKFGASGTLSGASLTATAAWCLAGSPSRPSPSSSTATTPSAMLSSRTAPAMSLGTAERCRPLAWQPAQTRAARGHTRSTTWRLIRCTHLTGSSSPRCCARANHRTRVQEPRPRLKPRRSDWCWHQCKVR